VPSECPVFVDQLRFEQNGSVWMKEDPTNAIAGALLGYLEPRLEDYCDELRQLCAIECPSSSKLGVDEAGEWVGRWANPRDHWRIRRWPDEIAGDSLLLSVRGGSRGGVRALVVAHLDTVYPVGTAAQRPMQREGDRIIGPGTCDNKSGLLSGLYSMAALEDLGLLEPFDTLSMLCGGDEETDMRSSSGFLHEVLPECDVAFVLEAARENGDIVSARKTSAHFVLEVRGKEAHAGVEPWKGANAILAISQQIAALQALNGMRPGVTVNVGVVHGGTLSNVVPGAARAEIDVRASRQDDLGTVKAAIERIAATPYVPGTTSSIEGDWRGPPMTKTPAMTALATLAGSCARELGFEVEDVATGGISYANAIAASGVPVLDGLGPIGGLDHSPDEYVLASSIVPRTALLALLLYRRAQSVGPR
jgi:glutamate carboxypeptidase